VTYADASALERDFGFVPKITLREGLRKFAEWYADYYGTNRRTSEDNAKLA
jgi:nucleoside-diphosphate-sugar epimerase